MNIKLHMLNHHNGHKNLFFKLPLPPQVGSNLKGNDSSSNISIYLQKNFEGKVHHAWGEDPDIVKLSLIWANLLLHIGKKLLRVI